MAYIAYYSFDYEVKYFDNFGKAIAFANFVEERDFGQLVNVQFPTIMANKTFHFVFRCDTMKGSNSIGKIKWNWNTQLWEMSE